MKFCPFCGAKLHGTGSSFCTECGKEIQEKQPDSSNERKARPSKHQKSAESLEAEAVDDYDGYYEDVLPPDLDRAKDGLDKAMVKKLTLLIMGAVLIIGLCVAMLYLL